MAGSRSPIAPHCDDSKTRLNEETWITAHLCQGSLSFRDIVTDFSGIFRDDLGSMQFARGVTIMVTNVGSADRLIRLVLGLILIVLPFVTSFSLWESPIARYGAPIVGVVFVVTSLIKFCPLYRLFGLRTCRV